MITLPNRCTHSDWRGCIILHANYSVISVNTCAPKVKGSDHDIELTLQLQTHTEWQKHKLRTCLYQQYYAHRNISTCTYKATAVEYKV